MPSFPSHHEQQRRVFRGRGGATDGRLPPKKNHRPKIKYRDHHTTEMTSSQQCPSDSDSGANVSSLQDPPESGIHHDVINDNDTNDNQSARTEEICHLQRRIANVQASIQTSRGICNPKIWHNNCLLPVKKALNQWRSICKHYHLSMGETINELTSAAATGSLVEDTTNSNNTCASSSSRDFSLQESILFRETSTLVFHIVQMAMQSGPLTGSNPGYFKRCGRDVASMAFLFLDDIVKLSREDNGASYSHGHASSGDESAAVLETHVDSGNSTRDSDSDDECIASPDQRENDFLHDNEKDDSCQEEQDENAFYEEHHYDNEDVKDNDTDDASVFNLNSEFVSNPCHTNSSSVTERENISVHLAATSNPEILPPSTSDIHIIHRLSETLLFSEKQSLAILLWIRNSQRAMECNRYPSKSSMKLHSLKSKKQQMKELKRERKLKKKKRSGGMD